MTRVITLFTVAFLVLISDEVESVYDFRGVRELPDHMTPAIDSKRRCASDPLGRVIDGHKIALAHEESVVLGRCAHVRVDSDYLTGTVHTPGRGGNAPRNIEWHKRAIVGSEEVAARSHGHHVGPEADNEVAIAGHAVVH